MRHMTRVQHRLAIQVLCRQAGFAFGRWKNSLRSDNENIVRVVVFRREDTLVIVNLTLLF